MLHLSFRSRYVRWWCAILIVFLGPVLLLSPIIYFTWYAHCGGAQREQKKNLQSLRDRDPVADAHEAILRKDFRLFATGSALYARIPGVGMTDAQYRKLFGYRFCKIYIGDRLTTEERQLNRIALDYFQAYNKVVYQYVNEHFPKWHYQ